MALASLPVPGSHSVLCTGDTISTGPAWEYDADGNRTDTQKRDEQGKLVFSVRGVVPLVAGQVVPDGSVHITQEIERATVRPGQIFAVDQAVFTVRAAKKFGLTGTLRGSRLVNPQQGGAK